MEATIYGKNRKKKNPTFKKTIGNLCQETHLKWDQVLPIALLCIQVAPKKWAPNKPYEVMYGRPFLAPQDSIWESVHLVQETKLKQYVQ